MKSLMTNFYKCLWMVVLCLGVFACSEDLENPMNIDAQLTSTEVKAVLNANEVSGITDGLIVGIFSAAPSDKIPECHQTTTSGTTMIITFNDCVIDGSEPINGMITATYSTVSEFTTISVSYTNLTIGANAITGSKIFTFANNPNNIQFTIESDMQVVMEDGQVINEKGTRIIGFILDNFEHQTVTLDGEWTVTSEGNTYIASIEHRLETILPCQYAGSGVMNLSKNGLLVTVDFGDGSCNDLVLVTYPDGTTEEVALND